MHNYEIKNAKYTLPVIKYDETQFFITMAKRRRKTVDTMLRRFFLTSHVIRLHLRRHNVVKTVCAYWIERIQKST